MSSNYVYYNSGSSLGVIGVLKRNVKHRDGKYTFIASNQPHLQWIEAVDLHNTRKEAEKARIAVFA